MKTIFAIASVAVLELIRRKDFYVLFALTALLTVLLGSVNFFNDPKIIRYLKEICLLLIWVSGLVIAVTTAARQIPQERESRTIFPLLAKPVTRAQVLLGKFFGCWFATGLSLVVFYAFFTIATGLKEHQWPLVSCLQALWLQWIMLGVVTAMTLLGSVVFTATSSNNTIIFIVVAGILFLGRHLHKVAMRMSEPSGTITTVIYYLIPHLEFYDARDRIIHGWEAVPALAMGLVTLYGVIYTALLLTAAWLRFRRQPL